MGPSEVRDLITALRTGDMTLDEVATRFRVRKWQKTRGPATRTYEEMADAALSDPSANVPGSFDEVTAAYDRGEITRAQYRTLAHAVADAINAEGRGGEG
jgi:hypothetical protein